MGSAGSSCTIIIKMGEIRKLKTCKKCSVCKNDSKAIYQTRHYCEVHYELAKKELIAERWQKSWQRRSRKMEN